MFSVVMIMIMIMIMIIFIHKKDTLQIMVTNIQHNPNLRMPVESYKGIADFFFRKGGGSNYL